MKGNYSTKDWVMMGVAVGAVGFFGYVHGKHLFVLPAKAVECGNPGQTVKAVLDDTHFEPSKIEANVCDTLAITYQGSDHGHPAAGPHPSHKHYPELDSKKDLHSGETFSIQLKRIGIFSIHDHEREDVTGKLVVTE